MTLCRFIAPDWLMKKSPSTKRVIEGLFSSDEIFDLNAQGYNVYYLPNRPKVYDPGQIVDGSMIDDFQWVFVDFDLKSKSHPSKDAFIAHTLSMCSDLLPNKIVDSGNGIHVYWKVSDLDAKSYLRLQRRMMRMLNTDEAVCQIFQLMRLPESINTKKEDGFLFCETLSAFNEDRVYTCEEMDKHLPPISPEDERYCEEHYNRTHGINQEDFEVSDTLPAKFGELLQSSKEVKEIWVGNTDDRSKGDYRLGHLLYAHGFDKKDAINVLVNSAKALTRGPQHRYNYAKNIVDKIWTFEKPEEAPAEQSSPTVRDLLSRGEDTVKGTRFPCHKIIDDTLHGFRLGQVLGIVGGSGVGKTTLTLNAFLWFAENNPDYHHFFFSLEQPAGEIASRIRTICQGNETLFDKIHIVSNYKDSGEFQHFSIDSVEDHILKFELETKKKVGAVVVDHIGVLAKSDKNGETDGLIGICRRMKAVAVKANVMLIMLSQAPREKAGIGDLELNKDAAFGTVFFESFLDYLICLWQPLKRAYNQGAPTIMAFKFAKIRHKKQGKDRIQEDVCYQLYFDPDTELLRELTQSEETAARHYLSVATNLRKADRKTDVIPYQSRRVDVTDGQKA